MEKSLILDRIKSILNKNVFEIDSLSEQLRKILDGSKLEVGFTKDGASFTDPDYRNSMFSITLSFNKIGIMKMLCNCLIDNVSVDSNETQDFDIDTLITDYIVIIKEDWKKSGVENLLNEANIFTNEDLTVEDVIVSFSLSMHLWHEIGHIVRNKEYNGVSDNLLRLFMQEKSADDFSFAILKEKFEEAKTDAHKYTILIGAFVGLVHILYINDYEFEKNDLRGHPFTVTRCVKMLQFLNITEECNLWRILYCSAKRWLHRNEESKTLIEENIEPIDYMSECIRISDRLESIKKQFVELI